MSEQNRISSNNITTVSSSQVIQIKKNIWIGVLLGNSVPNYWQSLQSVAP